MKFKLYSAIFLLGMSSFASAKPVQYDFGGDFNYDNSIGELTIFDGGSFSGSLTFDDEASPIRDNDTIRVVAGSGLSVTLIDNQGDVYTITINNGFAAVLDDYVDAIDGLVAGTGTTENTIDTVITTDIPNITDGPNFRTLVRLLEFTSDVLSSTSLQQPFNFSDFPYVSFEISTHILEDEGPNYSNYLRGTLTYFDPVDLPETPVLTEFSQSIDIGYVSEPGTFAYDEVTGTHTMNSGGFSIGAWEDWCYFVFDDAQGDLDFRAQLQSIDQSWATAGIMIRNDLTTGSKYAASLVTRDGGGEFSIRQEEYTPFDPIIVPTLTEGSWLRLEKVGNTVSNYVSDDGETWTLIGSEVIEFGENFYVGIVGVAEGTIPVTQIIVDNVEVEFK